MNRSTVLLLGLLVVLGAIVYFVLPGDEEQIASYDRAPVAFSVDSASVVKVSIERAGKALVVENVGGAWTITSHGNLAADPARVLEVVGGLSRFRPGSLVSSNPAKQSVFQVDSSGSLVTLTERSGTKRSIIVGKMGPSFSEVYFRMPGESNVYLGSGITTWSLEREVKDWRARTIFATPAEAVTGLTISSGGRSREFRKDSAGWTSGSDPVPTETINPVLTALTDLRAEDFIDSDVQFTGAPSTVEIAGGVSGRLEFYRISGDTARYAVGTSWSAQRYIVGRFAAAQLFKPVGDPRSSGVASIRRGVPPTTAAQTGIPGPEAAAGRPRAETGTAPKASAEAEPVRPAPVKETAREPQEETRKEPPAETVRPPASTPPSTGAVNPFKQKPAGERSGQTPAVTPPPTGQTTKATPPAQTPAKTPDQAIQQPPAAAPAKSKAGAGGDDEGELTVHVVKKGESMTTIASQYGVSVEQILKWNLLKSISVKPGQELYIFVRK